MQNEKKKIRLTRSRVALVGVVVAAASLGSAAPYAVAQSPANADARIIRVAPAGNDSGSCGSEASPCKSIQFAVNQAASGDEIRVAAGTYTDTGVDGACSFLVNAVVCVNNKALTLRGGFAPGNWSSPNPSANSTIIDGQNANRGVNVVLVNRLTMEGFTIQNGRAGPEAGDPNAFGGGMTVIQGVVTLRDMVFRNNQVIGPNTGADGGAGAGAALAIRSAPAGAASTLERVTFQDNTATGGTGANRGGFAFGAVFVYQSSVNIVASTFTGNRALAGSGGGGIGGDGLRADALGGAIALQGGSMVNISGVQANNNEVVGGNASQYGGGAFGGGLMSEDSTFTVVDSQFRSNVARGGNGSANGGLAGGGGILAFNSNARIERVQVIANRLFGGNASSGGTAGTGGGGGLYLWRGRPDGPGTNNVTNAVIADNAIEMGQGRNIGGGGGGIQVQGLTANLTHVTLARNRLGSGLVAGQAMVVVEAPGVSATTVNLNHSIIADHTGGTAGATAVVVIKGNTLNFNRGLFANNSNNTNGNFTPIEPGNINGLNTLIGAGSAGFAAPGSPNFDYRLTSNSPAIDQAAGSTTQDDFEGQTRPNGQAADLGADEFGGSRPDLRDLTERVNLPILTK